MSWLQRFLYKYFPNVAKDMEAESRRWMLLCPNCGHEQSFWDIGGVRWKAYSKGKRTGVRCPNCHRFGLHKVYYKQPAEGETATPPPSA